MTGPTPKAQSIKEVSQMVEDNARVAEAHDATQQEHEMGLLEALSLYPKGVFWSIVMSTAVIMEGYDTKLMGSFYAQPAFQKAYGVEVKPGSYQITAPWQAGLGNGSTVGQLIGLLVAGYASERFGFRRTMLVSMVVIVAFIFIPFFAPNIEVLEVGQVLFGIPLGLFQTVTVVYASEITPLCLRPYLTNYVNFCWAFGQIIATGLLRGVLSRTDEWAYRIPFAAQWVWPAILMPAIYLAPESPWWLVRRGRLDQARRELQRLTSARNVHFDLEKNISLMLVTTEHERAVDAATSYWACFRGVNARRTVIAIGIYCIQTLSGNPLRAYSTYFLQQAGMPTTQAFNMAIIGYGVAIGGGFFSWVLLPLFGRRTIYLWGLCLMFIIMVLVGGLGVPQAESPKPAYAWAIGSVLIVSSFLYNCSIGPLTNTLCAEIPSTLLRSKTVVLARWSYTVTSIIAGTLTPYQLNPTAWNWAAKTGFFWAGACLLSIVFSFFYVPESKGRTTAEMDLLFEKKVTPRRFAKTQVNFNEIIPTNNNKEESV